MILDTNAVSSLFAGDNALAAVLAPSARHHLPVISRDEHFDSVRGLVRLGW